MAKKYAALRAKMSPEARGRVEARVQATLAEMPLQALRTARAFTQQALARTLDMTQPEVSKIEHRADVYVSTLRSYIEALGGNLEIVARFPDGDAVRINQFEDLAPDEDAPKVRRA